MDNTLNQNTLFIDFDSTFVKVETINELAKLSLKNDPEADTKISMISDITNKHYIMKYYPSIELPVSMGEALDKLTILNIKMKKITDSRKVDVEKEFNLLSSKFNVLAVPKFSLFALLSTGLFFLSTALFFFIVQRNRKLSIISESRAVPFHSRAYD